MTNECFLQDRLEISLNARLDELDAAHTNARRLFSGFYEGEPRLVAEVYGTTLLLTAYSETEAEAESPFKTAQEFYLSRLPWLACVMQKQRLSKDPAARNGKITFGNTPAASVQENGIQYALELTLNQDASFYLDTRNLRAWMMQNTRGLEVLNTFAYTGSLGVAALAGGAARVVQVDRSAAFLALARRSAALNHLDLGKMKLRAADVFSEVGRFKREGQLFDLVLLDPPFFSVTEKGKVDQAQESTRLINKLRPLVRGGGRLVAVNNALFLSGQDYLQSLETLCADGYLHIEEFISIPEDITGSMETIVSRPPVDPAPFNHPTKIAVLRVRRK